MRKAIAALWLAGLPAAHGQAAPPTQRSAERHAMVREQIEARGITNPDVLRVMRELPRHLFMPEAARVHAYEDSPVSIGHGQTISQPYIVAYMTQLLEPSPKLRVLEIGTGSGYQAAILGKLFGEVYSIEIVKPLADAASAALKSLGIANVHTRVGDGYQGWPGKAPFDRILLTAAPPELPQALVDQLAPGGILVAPVGSTPLTQELVVVRKSADGKVTKRADLPVRFVPMVPGR